MDAAFPFVSSSDRSKYMELCQALSNLNGITANPDFEDPVEMKSQKLKKLVVEEVGFQPEVPAKVPQDTRKPFLRAKSHTSRNLPKANVPQHGNVQTQELMGRRSSTPRAPADQKKKKLVMSEENPVHSSKLLPRSSSRASATQYRVKGKRLLKRDILGKGEVEEC